MTNATWLREDETFTISGRTYHEAAGYMASFVAYISQRATAPELTVEAKACLSPGDRRVLR